MANTPEGKVKKAVRAVLQGYCAYYHMPVQNGMGMPTLDFVGCDVGRYYAIETKAKGKKLTPSQEHTAEAMRGAGAKVFVIDDTTQEALEELTQWLNTFERQ